MSKALDSLTAQDLVKYITELNAKTESEKNNVVRLKEEVQKYTPDLYPNGIKDISKLIWPYTMNTGFMDIGSSSVIPTANQNISNNNRAGFVINKIIPTVFEVVGANDLKFIDLTNEADDLIDQVFVRFSDSSSDRYFNTDYFHIAHLGNSRFVSKMLSNPIIPPNSGFYVELSSKGTKQYKVCMSLVGYRIDIQDNGELLSYSTLD